MIEPISPPTGTPLVSRTIAAFVQATGATRTRVYADLKAGNLSGKKLGRRTLITTDPEAYIDALPAYQAAA